MHDFKLNEPLLARLCETFSFSLSPPPPLSLFFWGRAESTRSRDDYVTTAPKREPGRRRLISIARRVVVAGAQAAATAMTVMMTMTMDFVL